MYEVTTMAMHHRGVLSCDCVITFECPLYQRKHSLGRQAYRMGGRKHGEEEGAN